MTESGQPCIAKIKQNKIFCGKKTIQIYKGGDNKDFMCKSVKTNTCYRKEFVYQRLRFIIVIVTQVLHIICVYYSCFFIRHFHTI